MDVPFLQVLPEIASAGHSAPAPLPAIESASWVSQFLFLYMYPVFARAVKKRALDFSDIPVCGNGDDPVASFRLFFLRYGFTASLTSIHNTYWIRWWYSGLLLLVSTAGSVATPYLVQQMLICLDSPACSADPFQGFLWALAIAAASGMQALTIHKFWYESSRVGLHSQYILSTAVFAKGLQLSTAARSAATHGKLVNNMASDASKVNDRYIFPSLHWQTWSAALTVVVSCYNLWVLLGLSGAVCVASLAVCVPLSGLLTRCSRRVSERIQSRRDARGKLVQQLIAGVLTLRVNGWIGFFRAKVTAARAHEVEAVKSRQLLGVASDFAGMAIPIVILAGTFVMYTYLNPDAPLSAATAFSVVNWIAAMQFPLRAVPSFIVSLADVGISLDRLRKLFAADDTDISSMQQWTDAVSPATALDDADGGSLGEAQLQSSVPMQNWLDMGAIATIAEEEQRCKDGEGSYGGSAVAVEIAGGPAPPASPPCLLQHAAPPALPIVLQHACFGWPVVTNDNGASGELVAQATLLPSTAACAACAFDPAVCVAALHDVSLSCARGTLTLVAGTVGSGKSTLLSGLVGEAQRLHGTARVRGHLAYSAQSPWVMNRSVRENITLVAPPAGCGERENIVLVAPPAGCGEAWYGTVVRACALQADVDAFARGHDTLIGDAGVTLSGGQKARVSLARAVYADADVVLLDDVLGACDAIVAAHIWTECVVGLLLARGKTVLMATHAVHFASRREVARVLVLHAGRVVASGSFAEVAAGPYAAALIPATRDDDTGGHEAATADVDVDTVIEADDSSGVVGAVTAATAAPALQDAGATQPAPRAAAKAQPDGLPEGLEKYAQGSVQVRHVLRYVLSFGSGCFLALLGSLYVLSQAAVIAVSWWLSVWVQHNADDAAATAATNATALKGGGGGGGRGFNVRLAAAAAAAVGLQPNSPLFFAAVYAGLNTAYAALTLLRTALLTCGALHASTQLHDAAFRGMSHAPAAFFAHNPAGRILNRFLADVGNIDDTVRSSVSALAVLIFQFIGTVVIIGVTTPLAVPVVAALSVLYYFLAQGYRLAARDLRRMQSVSKSPIIALYAETLRGLATIRAFGPAAAVSLVRRHLVLSREYGRAYLAYMGANEYISTWLEGIGVLVVTAAALLSVQEHRGGGLTTAGVGLLLSFVLQMPSTLMWLIRGYTQVEIDAVSIERVVEYADLESEEAMLRRAAQEAEPPADCRVSDVGDDRGAAIQCEGVSLRYGGPVSPVVLRALNLRIPRGAKVALLGRSGAGKSTLLQALLRLYPPHAGRIVLCGDDAAEVSAAAFRRHLTALLQDGWLFAGTVLENLLGPDAVPGARVNRRRAKGGDNAHPAVVATELSLPRLQPAFSAAVIDDASDSATVIAVSDCARGAVEEKEEEEQVAAVWAALARVSLADTLRGLPGGLDAPVAEGGANFSAGERALLCLARALLRHRRLRLRGPAVVLCDEPTASVDHAADAIVHDTILGLPDTVLCICHRLHYVPRFDLVAVVDGGRVAEFGPPEALRRVPGSRYARLLQAAATSGALRRSGGPGAT